MNIVESFAVGDLTANIVQDDHCDCDPRTTYDNLGVMACFHKRYSLGDDVTNFRNGKNYFPDVRTFNTWVAETKPILLPLYLFDHSGITMRTVPYGCPWDSGQVGWIFCTLEKACKEFGVKKVTPTIRRKVEAILRSEVEVYDAHLRGECYGYTIRNDRGDDLESSWGYHGYKRVDWDYLCDQAKSSAAHIAEKLCYAANI